MPFEKIHSTLPCKNFSLTLRPSKSKGFWYIVNYYHIYLPAKNQKRTGTVPEIMAKKTRLADTLCFFIGQIQNLLTILDDINCVEIGDFELSPSVNFSSIHSRHGHNRIYSLSQTMTHILQSLYRLIYSSNDFWVIDSILVSMIMISLILRMGGKLLLMI